MFYEVKVKSHVRVDPISFKRSHKDAILESLNKRFEGFINQELGAVIAVSNIEDIGEGVIVPGDGAAYYETVFTLFTYKPELQEVVLGRINDITDFGAFIDIGPLDGMIHVSQTMDDYVTFSKSNVLQGKETKRIVKVNDKCRARIIAVSYKDPTNPKIGLTMRQLRLGPLKSIEDDIKKEKRRMKKGKKK